MKVCPFASQINGALVVKIFILRRAAAYAFRCAARFGVGIREFRFRIPRALLPPLRAILSRSMNIAISDDKLRNYGASWEKNSNAVYPEAALLVAQSPHHTARVLYRDCPRESV